MPNIITCYPMPNMDNLMQHINHLEPQTNTAIQEIAISPPEISTLEIARNCIKISIPFGIHGQFDSVNSIDYIGEIVNPFTSDEVYGKIDELFQCEDFNWYKIAARLNTEFSALPFNSNFTFYENGCKIVVISNPRGYYSLFIDVYGNQPNNIINVIEHELQHEIHSRVLKNGVVRYQIDFCNDNKFGIFALMKYNFTIENNHELITFSDVLQCARKFANYL